MTDRDERQVFYKSRAWEQCRDAYAKSVGGLCERCRAKGLVVSGEIVHHKIHLTAQNMNDPDISLNFDNLELLCRKCHGMVHRGIEARYGIQNDGRIYILT